MKFGKKKLWQAGVLLALAGVITGIAVVMLKPPRADYLYQRKLDLAVILGETIAIQVSLLYRESGAFPASIEKLPIAVPIRPPVSNVSLNAQNGTVTVTLDDPTMKDDYGGNTLTLVPSLDSGRKNISWACTSQDISSEHLPESCRQFHWEARIGV